MKASRAALAVTAGVLAAGSACSVVAPPPVLGPGAVTAVGPVGISLTAPADGRVRGAGFTATVTGVGAAREAAGHRAGPRAHLVIFSLGMAGADGTSAAAATPAAAVVVGESRIGFAPPVSGTRSYAVSVPDDGPEPTLVLSAAGLDQSFSLAHLVRLGSAPKALYRDPASLGVPLSNAGQVGSVEMDEIGGTHHVAVPVTLQAATLAYFSPPPEDAPASAPDRAMLAITLSAPKSVSTAADIRDFVDAFDPYPLDAVSVVLPDGSRTPARHVGPADAGLFPGTYLFDVPATLTDARLVLGAANGQADAFQFSGQPGAVSLAGTTLPLSFPAAQAQAAPAPVTLAVQGAPPRSRHLVGWIGSAVVLVVLAGGAVALAKRARRTRQPRPRIVVGPSDEVPEGWAAPEGGRAPQGGATPTWAAQVNAVLVNDVATERRTGVTDNGSRPAAPPWVPPEPAPVDGAVVVRVLGPLEVTGWAEPPTGRVLTDLSVYLALHDGKPVPGERLRAALWPPDEAGEGVEASAETLRTYVSRLRRALGGEHVPEAVAGAGYRLGPGVVADWVAFRALTSQDDDPEALGAALALVRGEPFGGDVPHWAYDEGVAAEMENGIAEAAHRLATVALGAGDHQMARWAAGQGLRARPRSSQLHEDRLRADAVAGELDAFEADRADASRRLDELAFSLLDEKAGQLRAGFGRPEERTPPVG